MTDASFVPALEPFAILGALWRQAGLPEAALAHVALPGDGPVLPSSFPVANAAQASLGAAALAGAELWHLRRGTARQDVSVDRTHATLDSLGWFSLDGVVPDPWDKLSGLYRCGADAGADVDPTGWVRIHANFAHQRDGALQLLGLPTDAATGRAEVENALRGWRAQAFESAAAAAGVVVSALRSFDEWDAHPQGRALIAAGVATMPVRIERLTADAAPPRAWPALADGDRPLHGLRVLDLTRILAGPVAGRTLAAYGAEVMLVNSPHLPNIDSIADTSRGKLSAHVDLKHASGLATLKTLLADAHVFLQGYRPGALSAIGFGAEAVAALRPGIVHVSLAAYGFDGPWRDKRGFDSLVQTATGFNDAEARAAGAESPKAMPLQILDYAAGYLLAFGAQAALWRQQREGGSWQVQVSLAGVGHWLRGLGRIADGFGVERPDLAPYLDTPSASGFGELRSLRHAARFSETPAGWTRASMPPGSHPAVWPR